MADTKNSKSVDTKGGAYIKGNVTNYGLFIGRDYHHYDFGRFLSSILTHLGWFRVKKLDQSKAFSKARCVERWIALGVPDEQINTFLENPALDRTERIISFDVAHPLKILIGDFGAGKSLIAEMLFQRLVDDAIHSHKSPIPILIPSSQLTDELFDDIERESELIGDWQKFGARVIIDGADEISPSRTRNLLKQAITITKAEPKTLIIITSRPLPDFENNNFDKVIMPELSNDEIRAIIETLSGHKEYENFLYKQPQAILDSLKKPFFSVLYGLYQKQLNNGFFKSTGELISYLVEKAVIELEDAHIIELLEKLAILSIRHEGQFILANEIGSMEQINLLLKSRLVIMRGKAIGFALPILTQWFAARSIENNKVPTEELTSSLSQIQKWRYPLIVLISNCSFEVVSRVLIPIAELHPGIIAEIINAAVIDYWQPETPDIGLPNAKVIGGRIVVAMQALSNGLGMIAGNLAPIRTDGKVSSIGIRREGDRLDILWYSRAQDEGIVELPNDFGARWNKGEYPWSESIGGLRPGLQGAWAWKLSLDAITKHMKKTVKNKKYTLKDWYSFQESMWETANKIMGYGELSHRFIPIKDIQKRLDGREMSGNAQDFLSYLNSLQESGEENIVPLWPGPDKEMSGGWIWGGYSPERLVERARLIYAAALEEYVNLVNYFFSPLAERLTIYATLPAKFVMHIVPSGSDWNLFSVFDPLPLGEKSYIEINLSSNYQIPLFPRDEHYKKLEELRPGLSRYHGIRMHGFEPDFFGGSPVKNLIYSWLLDDLHDISWIDWIG